MQKLINASDCKSISDVRGQIDLIDREVVHLIARRFEFVKKASDFKKNTEEVKAKERFNAMLAERRLWATNAGLNADVIEKIFKDLVQYFIKEELKEFENKDSIRANL
ncbi:chorismate mutase [Pelobium manganitolerans]|uniref:chorismate mutase n=1 Tax=Pelobium manganitolerans TaxID=1842495 RepID=UPI003FA3A15D